LKKQPETKEPQYDLLYRVKEKHGIARLGLMVNESWNQDPRRTVFTLARYKFVSKMLEGRQNVLEVGCADAFGTRLVQQTVGHVTAVDFDPLFIDDVKERMDEHWNFSAFVHDALAAPVPGNFDAVYALDVLEHISPENEEQFLTNCLKPLASDGVAIFGMPSLESQPYASPQSKAGHVNCKTMPDFKRVMERYFHSVFMFSMNDEVVHTGYHKMAHYLIALGAHKRTD
jgi:2-polyprenyl-3-methyl-5-hydroxy-6-metoxy-1,4-benzoquinol methylase